MFRICFLCKIEPTNRCVLCRRVVLLCYVLACRFSPGAGVSAVSKRVGGLPSWSVQLDGPGTALTVGGWIRPGGKTSGVGGELF